MLSSRFWLLLAALALALPLSAVGCGDEDTNQGKPNDDDTRDDGRQSDEEPEPESDDDSTGRTTDARVRDASQMDATVGPKSSDASADVPPKHDAGPNAAGPNDAGPHDAGRAEEPNRMDAGERKDAGQTPVKDAAVATADAATVRDAGRDAGDLTMPLPKGTCGTFLNVTCPVAQYCDLSTLAGGSGCHVPGGRGVCKPIPSNCDAEQTLPVCTCDGALYWKACLAILAGQTVDYGNPTCIIPPIMP